ncbi:MAG: hypothetical protein V1774_12310 [Candidatus Eisenbacteria bacterium]
MRTAICCVLACGVVGALLVGVAGADPDNRGFLYGRILTTSDSEYEGFLRWGDEESCWDDLFHSTKDDLPYQEMVDPDERGKGGRRRGILHVFSWLIEWESDEDPIHVDRVFICRFGDIAAIEVTGDEEVDVVMKNGTVYAVSGYSNDVGGTIHVEDPHMGKIDLHWDKIDSIRFMPAPAGARLPAARLHGRVDARAMQFEGFIQWDKEECLSIDRLDGETQDGDVSLEMGQIRVIERRSQSSSSVEMKDGRTLRLSGTNDVNSENRGIMIEDPRFGRVTVPWSEFEKITFQDRDDSGRGFADFPPLGPLTGVVTDRKGARIEGRIVLDLDEAEGWEMLNGSWGDIAFDIPLAHVQRIETQGRASRVTLHGGEHLDLEEGQDVTDSCDGVLIFRSEGADPLYLPWEEVKQIEFTP